MTVKIDIEMPKSCSECRGMRVSAHNFLCFLADERAVKVIEEKDLRKRPSWCPLQEVKE